MNIKTIPLCYAKISTDANITLSATQLRSYIGYRFVSDTEFHHHDDNPFRYPLIQYKSIHDELYVIGMLDCTKLVYDRISSLHHIIHAKTKIPITNTVFHNMVHTVTDNITQYKFVSPWFALNSKNSSRYKLLDKQFRKRFLEDVLIGNMLSLLKGLNIHIDYRIHINLKWYKPVPIVVHKKNFTGFYAEFATNLSLPKYMGLGKSVSKGFGIVEAMRND